MKKKTQSKQNLVLNSECFDNAVWTKLEKIKTLTEKKYLDRKLPKNIIKELTKEIDSIDYYFNSKKTTISYPLRITVFCDSGENDLWFEYKDIEGKNVDNNLAMKQLKAEFKIEMKNLNIKIKNYAKFYNISVANIREQLGIV